MKSEFQREIEEIAADPALRSNPSKTLECHVEAIMREYIRQKFPINIGDVVSSANNNPPLVSGSGSYDEAVCISQTPFVLVSPDGDMRWNRRAPDSVVKVRKATTKEMQAAMARWER